MSGVLGRIARRACWVALSTLLGLAGLILTILLFAFVAFEQFEVRAMLPKFDAVLAKIDPEDRQPTSRLVAQTFDRNAYSANSRSVLALLERANDLKPIRNRDRVLYLTAWTIVLPLHYGREDRIAAYFGLFYRTGLSAVSRQYFSKPLSALTDIEADCIAKFMRGPNRPLPCLAVSTPP